MGNPETTAKYWAAFRRGMYDVFYFGLANMPLRKRNSKALEYGYDESEKRGYFYGCIAAHREIDRLKARLD